ncbi:unnamed protein product [Sphenostylis stenocarpa]|uniref:Uncharacterized protein n=1 Tax=Sphenostylis stenocarpa TaxID=92480 RepID=A0AA86VIA9_9FABA|nr:unnamed protein product [Sphenostylis stenocarpa]
MMGGTRSRKGGAMLWRWDWWLFVKLRMGKEVDGGIAVRGCEAGRGEAGRCDQIRVKWEREMKMSSKGKRDVKATMYDDGYGCGPPWWMKEELCEQLRDRDQNG